MVRSTVSPTQVAMSELAQDYQFDEEEDIIAFLGRYPDVAPVLLEIRSNIRRFFDQEEVRLEVFEDPEWPDDDPTLVVNIQTQFASGEALDRLHRFDREWWIVQLKTVDAPLLVSFEHIRRV